MNLDFSGGTGYPRRRFLKGMLAWPAGMMLSQTSFPPSIQAADQSSAASMKPEYRGPKVVLVRFGGGVRRRETIDPEHTYSPYLLHTLARQGTLFPQMEIASMEGLETGHGQGTLNLLTGKYDRYQDVGDKFLGQRFEAKVPTLFEYLRKVYAIPEHQTLIINGEDRTDEEFYSFSNHHLFGVDYRSNVLSLYRYKTYLLRRQIAAGEGTDAELAAKKQELNKLESLDYRTGGEDRQAPEMERFWERWREDYRDSGLVNPRGDRLLTTLAQRAIRQLRPRLLMINYNDPDYVHWGNLNHYTRGVSIIDQGLRQLMTTLEEDEEYRGQTILVIAPDCGRDTNPFAAVPCQHHFNSRSAHDIFALFLGPGIDRGVVVDKPVDQVSIAATVAKLMNFSASYTEGPVLAEAIA